MGVSKDDDRTAPRRRLPPCDGCGEVFCRCDLAADDWAATKGERLPRQDDDGRLSGGHLGDRDRGGKTAQLAEILRNQGGGVRHVTKAVELRPAGHPMRHFCDLLKDRLRANLAQTRVLEQERRRFRLYIRALEATFDGDGKTQAEIGAELGHGRQWVNALMAEIRALASGDEASFSVAPRCPVCGREFVSRARETGGRPQIFCGDKRCGARARQRRRYWALRAFRDAQRAMREGFGPHGNLTVRRGMTGGAESGRS